MEKLLNLLLISSLLLFAGCGGGSGGSDSQPGATPPRPVPERPEDFKKGYEVPPVAQHACIQNNAEAQLFSKNNPNVKLFANYDCSKIFVYSQSFPQVQFKRVLISRNDVDQTCTMLNFRTQVLARKKEQLNLATSVSKKKSLEEEIEAIRKTIEGLSKKALVKSLFKVTFKNSLDLNTVGQIFKGKVIVPSTPDLMKMRFNPNLSTESHQLSLDVKDSVEITKDVSEIALDSFQVDSIDGEVIGRGPEVCKLLDYKDDEIGSLVMQDGLKDFKLSVSEEKLRVFNPNNNSFEYINL